MSLPLNLMVSKPIRLGRERFQFQLGVRYWVDSPDSGPEGIGLRAAVVYLFPR